jgi:molybdopterin converting factor small subunit
MKITARFIGAFKGITNKDKLEIKFEETVFLREVINRIVEDLPKLEQALIGPELEDPRSNALILINGKEISVLNGLETIVKDEDEVVFVPVLHGG